MRLRLPRLRLPRLRLPRLRRGAPSPPPPAEPRWVDIRLPEQLFVEVRAHVEDFSRGEEIGFLICSLNRLPEGDVLLAHEFIPLPDAAAQRHTDGSAVSWPPSYVAEVVSRALDLAGTVVLIHSHGAPSPRFSPDDLQHEGPLLDPSSRLLAPLPVGTVLLGVGDAVGSFWEAGQRTRTLRRIVAVGDTIDVWWGIGARRGATERRRLARQTAAIGAASDRSLAETRVAIIGLSGGGSHVVQQLDHIGVGTIIPVDDETVEDTNLGRLVGATANDIGKLKTDVAERVVHALDPTITVLPVPERFPTPASIDALKSADIIVSCVDSFTVRDMVNSLCRRYLIPQIDIGLSIHTTEGRLIRADGQLITSLPGRACLRCTLITDAVLAKERSERPPGYDLDPAATGEPQVVSMNGVLASEACNSVLDLITGYAAGGRGAGWWRYNGLTGELHRSDLPPRRPGCPGCAEEGLGDPRHPA